MAPSISSCHHAEEHFTLENSTSHTIIFYQLKSSIVTNEATFDHYKVRNPPDTVPLVFGKIQSGRSHVEMAHPGFESQFNTKDGLLHMLILNIDSIAQLTRNDTADSGITGRTVLKQLSFIEAELEKLGRRILIQAAIN